VYLSELEPRLQYCLRNLRIACKAVQIAIPLGELKLKLKNGGNISKSFYRPRSLYSSRPIQPYHFKLNLIWCDGTFKFFLSMFLLFVFLSGLKKDIVVLLLLLTMLVQVYLQYVFLCEGCSSQRSVWSPRSCWWNSTGISGTGTPVVPGTISTDSG
jgi:hypothetical protein